MSTRATVHFLNGESLCAIIYRHPDGYPEGLGQDLEDFFTELEENIQDTRFSDGSYLAAKWVVRDAQRYANKYVGDGKWEDTHRLEFLSVGVVMEDPGDIEFRYLVHCGNGRPKVTVQKV